MYLSPLLPHLLPPIDPSPSLHLIKSIVLSAFLWIHFSKTQWSYYRRTRCRAETVKYPFRRGNIVLSCLRPIKLVPEGIRKKKKKKKHIKPASTIFRVLLFLQPETKPRKLSVGLRCANHVSVILFKWKSRKLWCIFLGDTLTRNGLRSPQDKAGLHFRKRITGFLYWKQWSRDSRVWLAEKQEQESSPSETERDIAGAAHSAKDRITGPWSIRYKIPLPPLFLIHVYINCLTLGPGARIDLFG